MPKRKSSGLTTSWDGTSVKVAAAAVPVQYPKKHVKAGAAMLCEDQTTHGSVSPDVVVHIKHVLMTKHTPLSDRVEQPLEVQAAKAFQKILQSTRKRL